MQNKKVGTLVIGSGFSGSTVSSWLGDDCLIVERGEYRSFAEMQTRYHTLRDEKQPHWLNARNAYKSDIAFNQTYDLSGTPTCFSQFEFIGGGTSNRWDGNAVRISKEIFAADNYLRWPFSYQQIAPWYEMAEAQLNVCGDYDAANPGLPPTAINSGDRYRAVFKARGLHVFVRNQAKNPIRKVGAQNLCVGAGACEACPVDAKIRPEHLYARTNVLHNTLVQEINFVGNQAKSAKCLTPEGQQTIEFERVVIAAHAVESARLLYRSPTLPARVNRGNIGRFFQDHAQCDLRVMLPSAFPFEKLPFQTQLEVSSLTGFYEGVEVRLDLGVTKPALWREGWQSLMQEKLSSALEVKQALANVVSMSITFEMPPKRECYVDFSGKTPVVRDDAWMDNIHLYNKILLQIEEKLRQHGIKVLESRPHFRHTFGQHHLVGTLNMSAGNEAVVDSNFKLLGADNVYVAGTALIPRLGSPNPTLTAVAMANMLGAQLSGR